MSLNLLGAELVGAVLSTLQFYLLDLGLSLRLSLWLKHVRFNALVVASFQNVLYSPIFAVGVYTIDLLKSVGVNWVVFEYA